MIVQVIRTGEARHVLMSYVTRLPGNNNLQCRNLVGYYQKSGEKPRLLKAEAYPADLMMAWALATRDAVP